MDNHNNNNNPTTATATATPPASSSSSSLDPHISLFLTPPHSLAGLTCLITGSSRGLGYSIACHLASLGVNIILIGKTVSPHPKLPNTIYSALDSIRSLGGRAIACACDVRDEASVAKAVHDGVSEFGGIDILINNASALYLNDIEAISTKTFDLLHNVCYRGTFLMLKHCLPHLKRSRRPQVLTVAPRYGDLTVQWLALLSSYCVTKFNMAFCTLAAAQQWRKYKIPCNTIWPKVPLATVALTQFREAIDRGARRPQFFTESVYELLARVGPEITGNGYIDEDIHRAMGKTQEQINQYNVEQGQETVPDFLVQGQETYWENVLNNDNDKDKTNGGENGNSTSNNQ